MASMIFKHHLPIIYTEYFKISWNHFAAAWKFMLFQLSSLIAKVPNLWFFLVFSNSVLCLNLHFFFRSFPIIQALLLSDSVLFDSFKTYLYTFLSFLKNWHEMSSVTCVLWQSTLTWQGILCIHTLTWVKWYVNENTIEIIVAKDALGILMTWSIITKTSRTGLFMGVHGSKIFANWVSLGPLTQFVQSWLLTKEMAKNETIMESRLEREDCAGGKRRWTFERPALLRGVTLKL